MSLVILNRLPSNNYLSVKSYGKFLKRLVRFFLGQSRGSQAVTKSLLSGLNELQYNFKINPRFEDISAHDKVYVNESIEVLRWAVEAKKKGEIAYLVVGPILVVLPDEFDNIICDDSIDKILVPSNWVKNFWVSKKPKLENKIFIWTAGIDLYDIKDIAKTDIIIYQKNVGKEFLDKIVKFFRKNNSSYKIFKYGFYKHENYLRALDHAKAVVYLTESESQGIALCEAWMKDVPTIVWNRGYWEYKNEVWKDEKISAPYLNESCGMFFLDFEDFENKWNIFYKKIESLIPRKYASSFFSNKTSAENFLKLINE